MYPPTPDADLHLVRTGYTEHVPVRFGEEVHYACEPGYFFGHDYHATRFTLTCWSNGTWTPHLPWKGCVLPEERQCGDPPVPSTEADDGGEYDWTGTRCLGL